MTKEDLKKQKVVAKKEEEKKLPEPEMKVFKEEAKQPLMLVKQEKAPNCPTQAKIEYEDKELKTEIKPGKREETEFLRCWTINDSLPFSSVFS